MHWIVCLFLSAPNLGPFFSSTVTSRSLPNSSNNNKNSNNITLHMVHLHGQPLQMTVRMSHRIHQVAPHERPPDPSAFLPHLPERVDALYQWLSTKRSILTLTGAGLSTESGIPDYRGHEGSYHKGHKPMIHDQFVSSHSQRQRYWGRGMVGFKSFDSVKPNAGHVALTKLEAMRRIGVSFDHASQYFATTTSTPLTSPSDASSSCHMTVLTQNVDELHQRAGTKHVTDLHGRTGRLKCLSCGAHHSRREFTQQLQDLNQDWLDHVMNIENQRNESNELRPDGDAELGEQITYNDLIIPSCPTCTTGALKPDVVFFGDSVPSHRVARCRAAVSASDGLLCIGTSLAVHSAFRFVKQAASLDIPILVLNVGETRAERELIPGLTKVESPIGRTLTALLERLDAEQDSTMSSPSSSSL